MPNHEHGEGNPEVDGRAIEIFFRYLNGTYDLEKSADDLVTMMNDYDPEQIEKALNTMFTIVTGLAEEEAVNKRFELVLAEYYRKHVLLLQKIILRLSQRKTETTEIGADKDTQQNALDLLEN